MKLGIQTPRFLVQLELYYKLCSSIQHVLASKTFMEPTDSRSQNRSCAGISTSVEFFEHLYCVGTRQGLEEPCCQHFRGQQERIHKMDCIDGR